jgi:hypothetical protein
MNLPVHLQNRARRDLVGAALGGLNTGSPPHISIAGNRFTLVDDAGNEKPVQTLYLDVCVIDANAAVSKIFFDPRVPFEPGGDNSNPPICFSDNGIGASAQASQPQNTSCQLCPQNAWGSSTSKATGKPTKACNDVKKLAVLVPGMEMVFLLRIPPASLKHLAKYTQTLAGHGVDLPDAITRLEFESQGILKFTPMGYVDEATAAVTDKVIAAKGTDILIGRNDRPWGGQGASLPVPGSADAQKLAYASQQLAHAPSQVAPPPVAQPMAPPPQPFGGAAGTGGAASPFGATAGGQGGTSSPMAATQAGMEQTPPKRTRGPNKPKAEAAPPSAPAFATPPNVAPPNVAPSIGGIDDGIPPFLRRDPPQPVAPPVNPTQFGMQQNPPAPDAGIQAALDAAFRLPT